ncbi:hypothetical protein ACA910_000732 [Epithemia clementina (nom. ined.)]
MSTTLIADRINHHHNKDTLARNSLVGSTTTASTSAALQTDEEVLKTRILRAALDQVKHHGWTADAIVAAVSSEFPQASPSLAGMVTPNEMVSFAMDDWNQRLAHDLDQQQVHWQQQQDQDKQSPNLNTTATPHPAQQGPQQQEALPSPVDRVVNALKVRLEYQKDLVSSRQWHHGMAMGLSSPNQAMQTTQQLKTLMQTVVSKTLLHHQSNYTNINNAETNNTGGHPQPQPISDISQIALGAVYVATEFHMLADTSPNYQATWDFLRQRVQEWYQYQSTLGSIHHHSFAIGGGGGNNNGSLPLPPPWLFPFLVGSNSPGSSAAVRSWENTTVLASTVAKAFASGLLSLFQVNNAQQQQQQQHIPRTANQAVTAMLNSILPQTRSSSSGSSSSSSSSRENHPRVDGSQPSHYSNHQTESALQGGGREQVSSPSSSSSSPVSPPPPPPAGTTISSSRSSGESPSMDPPGDRP